MTDFLLAFLGLVAVFALSMGGFSKDTDGKSEIWVSALKVAIVVFVIGFIFYS